MRVKLPTAKDSSFADIAEVSKSNLADKLKLKVIKLLATA
jgi:hypothetical protein